MVFIFIKNRKSNIMNMISSVVVAAGHFIMNIISLNKRKADK